MRYNTFSTHIFKRWRRWSIWLIVILICALVTITVIDYDLQRGIWTVGIRKISSVTCLNDQRIGVTCWFYIGDDLVTRWPAKTTVVPTATPYPTSTPYPTATPTRLPLRSA